MPLSVSFRELVSGRRQGMFASLLRAGLAMAEVPYALAVRARNGCYDRGWLAAHRVGVPVVSVGNLTLGGTGKTPMVEWIARWMTLRGRRAAIVSRGYGSAGGAANDETRELAQRLPEVPQVQNPDRVAAARQAVAALGCQAIVLDDAFQHRRIARDLDLVLLDALEPFGHERVFPRGTLREPIAGLGRAHAVALSRADLVEPHQRDAIRRRVGQYAPEALWAEVVHAPQGLLSAEGERAPLESLTGGPVAAFCGLGNPAGFRHTLRACGYTVSGFQEFPDHHHYTEGDVRGLVQWATEVQAAALVCTHKDLVKLQGRWPGPVPLWAALVGLEFRAGQAALEGRLAALLAEHPVSP